MISRWGKINAMTSIHNPAELGAALRGARKNLGLTQPQLALAAGVGVRFIVDLEAGKPTLQLQPLMRVIDALGAVIHLKGLPQSPQAPEDAGNQPKPPRHDA